MMTEIQRLWAEHLTHDFPPVRGDEVHGVDLLVLDAEISGYITAFLDHAGRLAPARRTALAALARTARQVVLSMTGPEREHFTRLADIADLVIGGPGAGV